VRPLFATIVVLFAVGVSSSSAAELTKTQAKAKYYHAVGYIKAIGKNAHRTIYHSNPRIRHRWQAALRYLIRVRDHAYSILHPPPPKPVISWPPHHGLWMCIHDHEAGDWQNNDTGGNGHYGGLQMHPGWGYGTSYYASADSQYTQEWAAERGYQASGYSRSWLLGQWYHPDCLNLA